MVDEPKQPSDFLAHLSKTPEPQNVPEPNAHAEGSLYPEPKESPPDVVEAEKIAGPLSYDAENPTPDTEATDAARNPGKGTLASGDPCIPQAKELVVFSRNDRNLDARAKRHYEAFCRRSGSVGDWESMRDNALGQAFLDLIVNVSNEVGVL